MAGRISDIIPEELSPESEEKIRELVKRKMKGACGMLVRVLRILEEQYGPEVKEIVHDRIMQRDPRPEAQLGPPEDDLRAFCEGLERGCAGSHQWDRVVEGFWVTIELSVACVIFSVIIGVIGAWLQGSHLKLIRNIVQGYIQFFRNTPPFVQLLFFYFALGQFTPTYSPDGWLEVPVISNVGWAIISLSFLISSTVSFHESFSGSSISTAIVLSLCSLGSSMGFPSASPEFNREKSINCSASQ